MGSLGGIAALGGRLRLGIVRVGLRRLLVGLSVFARGEPRGVESLAGWYLFVGAAIIGSVASAFATLKLRPRPPE